jgi:hypothetical protein
LGLYPKYLEGVQQAIEHGGIWEFIRQEFIKNKKEHLYNKSAVKICTYSSFFQGGHKAMIEGILDNHRLSVGLRPAEFRKVSFYEDIHQKAREITAEMNNSAIINDFRSISSTIQQMYYNEVLMAPTGHYYPVNKETFKSSYPNYGQGFEFALIAQGIIYAVEKIPQITVLAHFHDGAIVCFPVDQETEAISALKDSVDKVGKDLGLWYPQVLEIKTIY